MKLEVTATIHIHHHDQSVDSNRILNELQTVKDGNVAILSRLDSLDQLKALEDQLAQSAGTLEDAVSQEKP